MEILRSLLRLMKHFTIKVCKCGYFSFLFIVALFSRYEVLISLIVVSMVSPIFLKWVKMILKSGGIFLVELTNKNNKKADGNRVFTNQSRMSQASTRPVNHPPDPPHPDKHATYQDRPS